MKKMSRLLRTCTRLLLALALVGLLAGCAIGPQPHPAQEGAAAADLGTGTTQAGPNVPADPGEGASPAEGGGADDANAAEPSPDMDTDGEFDAADGLHVDAEDDVEDDATPDDATPDDVGPTVDGS